MMNKYKAGLIKRKLSSISRIDSPRVENSKQLNTNIIRKSYSILRASHKPEVYNKDYELPSEESYNQIKLFVQSVKKALNELEYIKLRDSRVKTAETQSSDNLSPKDEVKKRTEASPYSLLSTRVSSVRTTEKKELGIWDIEELSYESEESTFHKQNEDIKLVPIVLYPGTFGLKVAVHDIMFTSI